MKQDQFNEIIEKQLETIKNTLLVKSKEYSTEDKLHNFRTSALMQQCTMEQALAGMLSKHTVSIYDMIHSGDRYHVDKWDEKINDHIVYLLLLRAIIEEKVCEEYIMGAEPEVMVNNPTYSFFMETLKRPYRSEFMDKKFNVPFEESCMSRTNAMIDDIIDTNPLKTGGLDQLARDINTTIQKKKHCDRYDNPDDEQ